MQSQSAVLLSECRPGNIQGPAPAAAAGGIKLSQTSPKFLHSNSTSHKWAFSAIAELVDNAYDPDCGAKELQILVEKIGNVDVLVFKDNGKGMSEQKLHKMLSFGYCEKVIVQNHKPIGQYGNGFKSGSMRLGKDALVFTVDGHSKSIGFLSQSYLLDVRAETVLIPLATWEKHNRTYSKNRAENLDVIYKYSPYKCETDILKQFDDITANGPTGTKIVIYNLTKSTDGRYELDFTTNRSDIILSEHEVLDNEVQVSDTAIRDYTPAYKRSLKEYCSILFLKPRMNIKINNHKVRTKMVAKSLSQTEHDFYNPRWIANMPGAKPVKITFGFNIKNAATEYGIMMYNKNRLIRAFERIGIQKKNNGDGKGVVGVAVLDCLNPTHNKQEFLPDERYNAIHALSQKLADYWMEKTSSNRNIEIGPLPDSTWAQCDECMKWRRLPPGIKPDDLPDKWYCWFNPSDSHNDCSIEEESEAQDEEQVIPRASYPKTQKKLKELKRRSEVDLRVKNQEIETMRNEFQLDNLAKLKKQESASKQKILQLQREIDQIKGDQARSMLNQSVPEPHPSTSNARPSFPRIQLQQRQNASEDDVQIRDVPFVDVKEEEFPDEEVNKKERNKRHSPENQVGTSKRFKTENTGISVSCQTIPVKNNVKNLREMVLEEKLKNLRKSVSQLLHIIVPDVPITNLEKIDKIVNELIIANSQDDAAASGAANDN
ncbi:MORC family CW-type zinc finger protein 3-like isoform X2 [Tubulanus polymorphus]|uniref:MORC family CW-type zinc finger protein 3-like isoform X2 n=1 Tax=Tubulanus polymorphus TaxID=672921 RepID=UPI003DA49439